MSTVPPMHTPLQLNRGLWMGLLGSVIFLAPLPLTKLAVASLKALQLSAWSVIFSVLRVPACCERAGWRYAWGWRGRDCYSVCR